MSRRAWVVIDLGFGDAGKGSVTDFLVRDQGAQLVVRFNGGGQAGHNVVTDDGRHHTFSQFGSGSFVPGVGTHLGPAFVLHPGAMLVEAEHLATVGVTDAFERTTVDERALVSTPFHQAANRLRELLRGDQAHGTVGVGVGECVEDAASNLDDTLRVADLANPDLVRQRLASQQRRKRAELRSARRLMEPSAFAELRVLEDPEMVDRAVDTFGRLAARLNTLSEEAAAARLSEAEVTVFEGAQGVLLDQTWGFHPHTTWSDCTVRGALALAGGAEVRRLGVTRGYAVRHGVGPFPSRDPRMEHLFPEPHNHALGWQGRVRAGPLDLVLLRYAVTVCGGLDGLVLTCLDRLPDQVPVCAAWQLDGDVSLVRRDDHDQVVALIPGKADDLGHREQLGTLLGWAEPLHLEVGVRELSDLVGRALGVPVVLESRGPTASRKRWVRPRKA